METPKPQQGTWTLTAPDGRTWQASSPLQCCGLESRERVPAEVALQRIKNACAPTPDEIDAARYRWLREQHWSSAQLCVVMDPKDAVKLGRTCPSREYLDIAVDDAMLIGRAVGAA